MKPGTYFVSLKNYILIALVIIIYYFLVVDTIFVTYSPSKLGHPHLIQIILSGFIVCLFFIGSFIATNPNKLLYIIDRADKKHEEPLFEDEYAFEITQFIEEEIKKEEELDEWDYFSDHINH